MELKTRALGTQEWKRVFFIVEASVCTNCDHGEFSLGKSLRLATILLTSENPIDLNPPDGTESTSQLYESVREEYIRNGGKEVKLFTSALKVFQCNYRIVMAQRKYLDNFLRGRIIGRLKCGRTQLEVSEELGIV
ncbi:HTH_Tnp_Tc3_2 domain-containing protein [Trichonephila clavipes]|nr:HTH_Tnp_Tc3_2 domain-containing protein [Trichonephila clavipes]